MKFHHKIAFVAGCQHIFELLQDPEGGSVHEKYSKDIKILEVNNLRIFLPS